MSNHTLRCVLVLIGALSLGIPVAHGADFYPIQTVDVTLPQGRSHSSIFTLIQGRGLGFEYDEPHDKLLAGAAGEWITEPCGDDCHYTEDWGQPIIELDMGQDRELVEISVWGHSEIFDSVSEFGLRFATAAEGTGGYGSSITYNPTFLTDGEDITRESFAFEQSVNARYVEFTVLDNFYEEGLGEGNQVGLGEIAFQAAPGVVIPVPDPVEFYPIESIEASTEGDGGQTAENLIEGPGVGFSDEQPHQRMGNVWYTAACGFPCDYLESFDPPVLWLDLGEDQELNEIDLWGYGNSNANGITEFSLRFATEADGSNGFGTSIDYNPTYSDLPNDDLNRMRFPFEETVNARYVELTALDNFFTAPGDNTVDPPGGDRMGMGEIAFPIIEVVSVPGDFNGNGLLDTEDINLLTGEVIAGNHPPAYDLNNDSLVDQADRDVWVEDLKHTWFGDANLDLEFNSGDMVQVFVRGKYETGEDAGWDDGDWNGDGTFGSSDMVTAFVKGGYEQGERPAVAAVPEPSAFILLALGLLGFLAFGRRDVSLLP